MASSIRVCPQCGKPIRSAKKCCGQNQGPAIIVADQQQEGVGNDYLAWQGARPQTTWDHPLLEAAIERRFRQFALPIALLLAWGIVHLGFPRMLLRTVFSMWIHELGHAIAAWLCGRFAFPGPWFTPVGGSRSIWMVLLVAGVIGFSAYRLWATSRPWAILVGCLFPIQLFCTYGLTPQRAQAFIIWSGDGGGMILGTLLMLSFYARPESQLRVGWLRWGFLVIGAAAYADALATWWAARTDYDAIPFGENEGRGLSDPTVLVFQHGLSIPSLVNSYVWLGFSCLAILAISYGLGLRAKN